MTLAPGTRLGAYEVLAPLGTGGIGEVYRACDPKLDREVAIKVLPSDISSNEDRRARFEREARAASALNHPNIVTIHDFGSAGPTFYMVMERVDGRTLRDILAAGLSTLAASRKFRDTLAGRKRLVHLLPVLLEELPALAPIPRVATTR